MRIAVLAVLLFAALAASGAAAEDNDAQLYAVDYGVERSGKPPELVRVDAASLRRVGSGLALRDESHTFSPDRRLLALSGKRQMRVVDLASLRVVRSFPLSGGEDVYLNAWLTPRRLIALVQRAASVEVTVVDPVAGRVVRRASLPGRITELKRLPERIILLVGPPHGIGSVGLVAIDAEGRVRTQPLAVSGGTTKTRTRGPALALDADQAYVVEPDGGVAVVDLETLTPSYHFATRAPASVRKNQTGEVREAAVVAPGVIAVTGWSGRRAASGAYPIRYTPAGLELVDTRTWTRRTVDPRASVAAFAGGTLVTLARTAGCVDELAVSGYALDGSLRFRMCGLSPLGILKTFGDRWLYVMGSDNRTAIVDIARGRVVGRSPRLQIISPIAPSNFGGYGI